MPQFDDQGDALGPYTTDGSWWPNATLMHGCVVAIGWPGVGWPGNENGLLSGESGGPPAASAINVAVGNTLTEALAALVAQHNNLPDEARILEGFLLSSLADLEQPDGRARLDALLQATAFGSHRWRLHNRDHQHSRHARYAAAAAQSRCSQAPVSSPARSQPPTLTKPHSQAANSTKYSQARRSGRGAAFSEPIETIRETTFLDRRSGLCRQRRVDHVPAPQQIPAHTEEVRRSLPRLFYPSEPVFLLEGANRTFKYGADTRLSQDNTLVCRLSGFYARPSAPPCPRRPIPPSSTAPSLQPMPCSSAASKTAVFRPSAKTSFAKSSFSIPLPR